VAARTAVQNHDDRPILANLAHFHPNQRSLLLAAQPQLQPQTLLPDDAPHDLNARLDVFMDAFTRYNYAWEPQLRTALRLSLEPGNETPVLRQGRAIGWAEQALEPLHDTHPHIDTRHLATAIPRQPASNR
jgi:hypothetical protein